MQVQSPSQCIWSVSDEEPPVLALGAVDTATLGATEGATDCGAAVIEGAAELGAVVGAVDGAVLGAADGALVGVVVAAGALLHADATRPKTANKVTARRRICVPPPHARFPDGAVDAGS
jgi:hypothetical protein